MLRPKLLRDAKNITFTKIRSVYRSASSESLYTLVLCHPGSPVAAAVTVVVIVVVVIRAVVVVTEIFGNA